MPITKRIPPKKTPQEIMEDQVAAAVYKMLAHGSVEHNGLTRDEANAKFRLLFPRHFTRNGKPL